MQSLNTHEILVILHKLGGTKQINLGHSRVYISDDFARIKEKFV